MTDKLIAAMSAYAELWLAKDILAQSYARCLTKEAEVIMK